MKTRFTLLAAAATAFTLAPPAFADAGQLAANAGIAPSEAAALSLAELAQAKFNRDDRSEARPVRIEAGAADAAARARLAANAGLSSSEAQAFTLTEVAAAKFNRESGGDDRQRVERGSVTLASRSVRDTAAWTQLIANAGLGREQATGLSLSDIAAAKFDRDTYN